MNILPSVEEDRKKTKKCIWIATISYLCLLPFVFMLAVASIMVFDSPSMTVAIGLSIIFMYFCVPLSIPVTLYLVWSRYSQGDYKKSRWCCLMPLCVFTLTMAYDALVEVMRFLF
jgi:Mn2+/Fe2+ NRAMP family transporter